MDPRDLPAFPTTEQHGFNSGCPGMTLRDYFAAKALNGICSHVDTWGLATGEKIAVAAYEMADAMLAARSAQ